MRDIQDSIKTIQDEIATIRAENEEFALLRSEALKL